MRHPFHILAPLALLAVAACSRTPDVDEQLRRDLEAASAGSIELAPMGAATKVVSGIEQPRRAIPRPTAPRPKAPPMESERVAKSQDPAPVQEPRVSQHAPASTEPVATRPVSAPPPRVQPPPPGGYKTMGEVIRNAPFPIKP